MNINREPEAVIAAWLDDGPATLPVDTRQAISVGIRTVPRRRTGISWRPLGSPHLNRFVLALGSAAAVVVVAALALNFYSNQPRVGGLATVSPSLPATATPPATHAGGSPEPTHVGGSWPQSSFDEMQRAQELADAGDPDYTWQVDPEAWDDGTESGGPEIAQRFLREVLGWESFLYAPFLGSDIDGAIGGLTDLQYLRCAPGKTNTYPNIPDQWVGADRCAPTADNVYDEVASIDLTQPVREGSADGIWVVKRWATTAPSYAQEDPVTAVAQAETRLEEFLQARLDGEGAESYVTVCCPTDQVPLLYATTTGAPYERYEIERLSGPRWPNADMEYAIRLFAEDGATVVEQRVDFGYGDVTHRAALTTENGRPVPQPYAFLDKLTVSAPHPWNWGFLRAFARGSSHGHMALEYDENSEERIEFVDDPLTVGTGCESGQSAASAAALAEAIRSDPDLVATAPVTVTIAGHQGLAVDISAALGASICADAGAPQVLTKDEDGADFFGLILPDGGRMRLYLLDAPEGSSIGILAIAVMAPESRFDDVLENATPILESMEFGAP